MFAVKFLACCASGLPRAIIAYHGVEDSQQLAHTGDHGDLLLFAGGKEVVIEDLDRRIMADGGQRRHVQDAADGVAPTLHIAFAPRVATIVIERRHADQRCELLAIHGAQLWQGSQESAGRDRADARHTLQHGVLGSPGGCALG